jgi:hypothetical protein
MADGGTDGKTEAMVGPLIVSHPVARQQLADEGKLTTFRVDDRTTGKTWWRESRTGPKRGDIYLSRLCECDAETDDHLLREFLHKSGFDSIDEWREAISELNGGLPSGYIYGAIERWSATEVDDECE